jgi:hypothetical protein
MTKIETNRKEALAQLNIKYASADKVKTSFGYIGIISLSALWFGIILNDLVKLFNLCYKETIELLKERQAITKKEINVKIEIYEETGDTHDLEEKLDKIHFQLLKACAARRKKA